MKGNAYRNRPEVQARSLENRRNPEWVRRQEVVRKTSGKLLGHFNKKKIAQEWFGEWVKAGKPRQPEAFPEFPEWLAAKRAELILRRDTEREESRRGDIYHADWLARGRPSEERTPEHHLALIELFRSTGDRKLVHVTEKIADFWKDYYERRAGQVSVVSDMKETLVEKFTPMS